MIEQTFPQRAREENWIMGICSFYACTAQVSSEVEARDIYGFTLRRARFNSIEAGK
jgi:hypothetical protein